MLVNEIKIIDLRFSQLDEGKSDPDKGLYFFKLAVPINYKDAGHRPDWYFRWERYEKANGFREYRDARYKGWEPVINGKDDFVALGADVNAEGLFQNGDLVLMKKSLMDVLLEAEKKAELSKAQVRDRVKAFKDEMKAQGAGVPESMIDDFVAGYLG